MEHPSGEQGPTAGSADAAAPRRRSFLAALLGGVIGLVPLASGIGVLLDPLRRKSNRGFVRVAPLAAIPDDGAPRMFPVVKGRVVDARTTTHDQPIGLVFLVRRPGERTPIAFTARCPHAGCLIGYLEKEQFFRCPCHTSEFHLDGSRIGGESSVAPRGMDTLVVKLETSPTDDGQPGPEMVLVEFKRFETGQHEKIPTA